MHVGQTYRLGLRQLYDSALDLESHLLPTRLRAHGLYSLLHCVRHLSKDTWLQHTRQQTEETWFRYVTPEVSTPLPRTLPKVDLNRVHMCRTHNWRHTVRLLLHMCDWSLTSRSLKHGQKLGGSGPQQWIPLQASPDDVVQPGHFVSGAAKRSKIHQPLP